MSMQRSPLKWVLGLGLPIAGLFLVFQNCGQPRYDMKDSLTDQTNSQGAPSPTSAGNTVCDPNSGGGSSKAGLIAEIYYLKDSTKQTASSVMDFFDPKIAEKSTQQVYFSQVNMPPQIFDKGFVTQAGELVRDNSGNKLIEWFALKYFSEIKITSVQDEGFYEFAALSDDGHIFEAQIDGQWKRIISDDSLHSPKWGCSAVTIEMKKDKVIPIRVYYFQGPAIHIANMLHWRKVPSAKPQGDAECGKSAGDYFYDPYTSTPLAPYQALLSRGWKVVPAAAFSLPSTVTNPCTK